MELYQLKCFLAAANCENFSRAAEEVHISQSSISKVIGRLEEELGVPLFERGHGRIMLNANGILFHHLSLKQAGTDLCLRLLQDAVEALRGSAANRNGISRR